MLIKVASLMLILLVALAFFGGLRLRKKGKSSRLASCKSCGRPAIGKGTCGCGQPLGRG